MAEKAFRRLHKHVDRLDPSVLNDLYGESIISIITKKRARKKSVRRGERAKKAGLILDARWKISFIHYHIRTCGVTHVTYIPYLCQHVFHVLGLTYLPVHTYII